MEHQRGGSLAVGGTYQSVTPHEQAAMFDEIKQEIGKFNTFGETIEQTYHLRKFAELFRRRITNDELLRDLFVYLNEEALSNGSFAVQLSMVFASQQLADASIYESNIRNAMIATLQKNFLAVERLKQENVGRFYNSITLLGEYYYRKRVAYGKRINILGQSLLLLLTSELEQEINKSCQQPSTYRMDSNFAKLVLAQITLNGEDAKTELKKELHDLLYTMRKALIAIPNLCTHAKAFLLMAFDIHYCRLGEGVIHKLYSKYLVESLNSNKTEQRTEGMNGGDVPQVNGVETEQTAPVQQQPATDERRREKQAKKAPGNDPPAPKAKESRSSTSNNTSGGSKTSNQNSTANDKENKRRSTQTKGSQGQITSQNAPAGSRSIRVQEDGNIVATITRDTPTPTTKKHPPVAPQPPASQPTNRSPTTTKPKLSPRMEKLATLPKITITSATPSPKHKAQEKPGPTSPRAVLGPSIAKQKPHPPPKSPTHSREGQQYGSKHVPQVSRARHDRNGRAAAKGTTQEQGESGSKTKNAPNQQSNGDGVKLEDVDRNAPTKASHSIPSESTATHDWSAPIESETTVESTDKDATNGERESTTKPKGKPSYLREENVENLSWDALIPLDDESPQKVNPHTKSFLSFLASE